MSVDRTKYLLNEAVTTIRDEAFPEIPANPSNTATTTSLHSWLLRTKSVTVPEPATAPAPPTFERNSSWLTTINTKGKQAAGERAVLPALSRLPSLGKELTGPKKDITWDTEAIHFQTFLIFYAAATKDLSVEQEMQQVFELLDDNNDGRILVSYFHQVLGVMFNHLPAENIRNLTLEARVATNENISDDEWLRNGVITYDDFVVFCSN